LEKTSDQISQRIVSQAVEKCLLYLAMLKKNPSKKLHPDPNADDL